MQPQVDVRRDAWHEPGAGVYKGEWDLACGCIAIKTSLGDQLYINSSLASFFFQYM